MNQNSFVDLINAEVEGNMKVSDDYFIVLL